MKRLSGAIVALTGRRLVVALAAPSCVAACLVLAGTAAAPASASPRPVQAARFDGAGHAALAGPGNVVQARPGHLGGSVVLGGSPGAAAANPKTDTLYVPIQCRASFCPASGSPGHVVDVINTATCNVKVRSHCRVVATARVGSGPLAAAVDERTDTVYVMNGNDDTVSVLNGARCNARVTRGCGRPVATIKVGKFPVAAALSRRTRTLYVANGGGSISVINAAACNARTTLGCGRPARTVTDKAGPAWIDVDVATDTVYVANAGASGNGDTVSVINGATCNGHTGRGCGRIPATVTVGGGPFAVAVDQASNTIYVPSNNDGTVSVINGARCNARVISGCRRTPPTVTTGAGPQFVAVGHRVHTAFTINQGDDTLSAINTRTCGRKVTSGCRKRPPNQQATPDHGPGFNSFPNFFTLVPRTGSAYVVNIGGANILSVTSTGRCNAADTTGCRAEAPSLPEHAYLISADRATNTIYAASLSLPRIDVINGATCHDGHLAGCGPVAEIPVAHPQANVGTVDHATHTLYAADPFAGTVSVINTATCNATDTTGCADHPATVTVGRFPSTPVINTATQTMYVPFGSMGNRVAVVNTATCNATDTTGCGQAPAVAKVGQGTFNLAVSTTTNTIYAANSGLMNFNGDTVSVINGATCNGTNHSGCGHLAATAKVGLGPAGITVNDRTHTVYVANNANGDSPGTISVINGATCNGTHTSGCHRHFPAMATGVAPLLAAVDTRTGILYVTDFGSAAVTILNGARCNATVTSGCGAAPGKQAVGSQPFGLAINPRTNTVYVTQLFQAGSMSVFRAARH
jgi:DNA-binding beta-propeller fold protein YncE